MPLTARRLPGMLASRVRSARRAVASVSSNTIAFPSSGERLPSHERTASEGVLSVLEADRRTRNAALALVAVSMVVFLALAPFAAVRLPAVTAFLPAIQSALIVNDVITAVLLILQLRATRSPAILVLACGYLYAAVMATLHLLSFPGVFAPGGLLGARSQTTAYLFVAWHIGLPIAALGYSILRDRPPLGDAALPRRVMAGLAAVLAAAAGALALTTWGHDLLPTMLDGNTYSSRFNIGRYGQWALAALALAVLWRRRPWTLLDIWLMLALLATFIEIALVAIFNAGRFDVGFYAGRLYALLASTTVLILLLREQARIYSGLNASHAIARSEAALREKDEVLRLAMSTGRMGAWTSDLDGDRVWWSPELEALLGLRPGTFAGTRAASLQPLHPEDRALVSSAIRDAAAHRGEFAVEARFRPGPGEWRWMQVHGRVVQARQGRGPTLFGVVIDITERKRGEEAARRADARFRTLADGIPQLAWMARPDGWIDWYNRRWYEYTGRTPQEMEGWGWQSVHDPQVLPQVLERWQHSISTGEPFEMVFPLRGADGRFRPFLTRVLPLKDEEGQVLHWFGTNTDITAQREAEAALRTADQRKDEFLATLAHELRNPLAPIRNAVEIMGRMERLPDRLDALRALLDRQSRQLTRLVDDLLEVSRITQGKVQLRIGHISLTEALRDAIESVRPACDAAGHRMLLRLSAEPLYIEGDWTRITQIFANLLNNAIKFTPRGGEILVTSMRDGQVARVVVRDNGIGIAPEHLPRIFEMFSQVTPVLDRSTGGLGIGLALVRGFVELHHGSVRANSPGLGKGSEFAVEFPLSPAVAAATERANPEAAAPPLRVLVADDNLDAASSLRALLEMSGHAVREAHDGEECLRQAAAFRPEVVLLDIGMPGMNGYEVARELRKRQDGSPPSLIVAVTGWGQERDRDHARQAGFDAHLTKPVDVGQLNALLAQREPGVPQPSAPTDLPAPGSPE